MRVSNGVSIFLHCCAALFEHCNRKRALCALAVVLILMASIGPAMAEGYTRPRLVVLIVADQFPYNYLSRFSSQFGQGGFRMLMDRGASFTNCCYQGVSTGTAVGHSVIASGAHPWATGIIADEWFDRRRGKTIPATLDEGSALVGGNGTAPSLRLFHDTTIGDSMRLAANNRNKVISVSLNPTASLLLGGRGASNAFWWDTRTGAFVTSAQYGHELPSWAQAFNDQHYAEKFMGKPWQRLLPETQYTASTRDDFPYERSIAGDGKVFPHIIGGGAAAAGETYFTSFAMTPFANQMIVDFAKEAIDRESLGQHGDPDLLAISLSAGESLGNAFGPYSHEAEDLCLRMDQSLASLFQTLDAKVGLDNCLVVFTSDHGSMPIPEYMKEHGMSAGRIDPKVFRTLLESALNSRLGKDTWISEFNPPNLYLNLDAIERQKYRQPDVEAVTAQLAQSVPGIGDIFTAVQFLLNQLPTSPFAGRATRSYYPGRSGELLILPRPGYVFTGENSGTATGSPYNYDCHVPLLMMGGAVQAGRFCGNVSPADIAPTVASILGIDPPDLCEGHALFDFPASTARSEAPRSQPAEPARRRGKD